VTCQARYTDVKPRITVGDWIARRRRRSTIGVLVHRHDAEREQNPGAATCGVDAEAGERALEFQHGSARREVRGWTWPADGRRATQTALGRLGKRPRSIQRFGLWMSQSAIRSGTSRSGAGINSSGIPIIAPQSKKTGAHGTVVIQETQPRRWDFRLWRPRHLSECSGRDSA